MKGIIAFGALLAVILIGLGLWTATPQGGGGLGEPGGAGQDLQDEDQGEPRGVVPQERPDDDVAADRSDGVVRIANGAFNPSTVRVPPNSIVTFVNRDDTAHGIDFQDAGLPDAEEIPPGGAHTVEVPSSGRFPFEATRDRAITGTIDVVEE